MNRGAGEVCEIVFLVLLETVIKVSVCAASVCCLCVRVGLTARPGLHLMADTPEERRSGRDNQRKRRRAVHVGARETERQRGSAREMWGK